MSGGVSKISQVLTEPAWHQDAPRSNEVSSDSMQALVSVVTYFPCSRHCATMDTLKNKKMKNGVTGVVVGAVVEVVQESVGPLVHVPKVTGGAPTTQRGISVVRVSNKPAKGGKVLQKGPSESKQQPPAKVGKVQPKSKSTPMPQPPASSTNAASGTVLLKTNPGLKPQPPVSSNSQTPLKSSDCKPQVQRIHVPRNLNEGDESSNFGYKAGGSRQPQSTGLLCAKKSGSLPEQ